ncbi:ribosomal protein S5 [Orobanche gracilis]
MATEEVVVAPASEGGRVQSGINLFNRWSYDEIQIFTKPDQTVRIVKHAMEIIHLVTDLNPIQVIVDAVINSGPREDATRIGSAGVVRRQAVDISHLRRVNQALYLLTTGARESAFRNIKTIAECLADELINAAKGSSNSYAIKKKDEIERVAKANR